VWVKKQIYKSKRKIRDAVVLFVALFDMAFAKNRRDGIKRCKVIKGGHKIVISLTVTVNR
jgi:hypothetical protein